MWIALFLAAAVCSTRSAVTVCTCIPGPALATPQMVTGVASAFDTIFEGTVVALAPARDSIATNVDGRSHGLEEVHATLVVHRPWKGVSADTVVVRTARDSAACGFDFAPHRRFLVFARTGVGGVLVTTKCSPTTGWGAAAQRLARLLGPSAPTP